MLADRARSSSRAVIDRLEAQGLVRRVRHESLARVFELFRPIRVDEGDFEA